MTQQTNHPTQGAPVSGAKRDEDDLQTRVQKELAHNRSVQQHELNRTITICWLVIDLTFMFSYLFEVIKGLRGLEYVMAFGATMFIPLLVCFLHYCRKQDDANYGVWVVCGYFVMYTFALMTGNTAMVFSYILPMLSFMVLLHSPGLILGAGGAALAVNVLSVWMKYRGGEINAANSKEIEIQLALILFCFAGSWLSSRIYNHVTTSNEKALERALEQESAIRGLENVVLVDKLTGLGNRAAYDRAVAKATADGSQAGVIFCDVNGLKYRNDHLGHQAGDQLLRDAASKMCDHFRLADCYRISGDEFVILIADLDVDAFSARAKRFHEDIWSEKVPMISVGWDHSVSDLNEAVKNAEVRMYADKKKFYEQYPLYART